MPDDERPSLEAPQLFGRRKRRAARPAAKAADAAPSAPVAEETTAVVPVEPVAEPAAQPVVEPVVEPVVVPAGSDSVFEDSGTDTTAVLPAQSVDVADPDSGDEAPAPAARPKPRRTPRDRSQPLLPGRPAALVSGLAAGIALLAFTWVGFQGCEAIRGTTSCGTAPGMVAIIVVFVLSVAVGGAALSRFGIPDPGATSFVGTGLTAVFYLLAVDYLDNWGVLVVVPAVTAGTFLLAWFLTTTFVDVD